MCGFIALSGYPREPVDSGLLAGRFRTELSKYRDIRDAFSLCVFTNGSFLDENEIAPDARLDILRQIAACRQVAEVRFETRPEYVTEDVLEEISDVLQGKRLQIAIGLETANDFVRRFCINKGFSYDDFDRAARLVIGRGQLVVYLVVKPLFLNELEAIGDVVESARAVMEFEGSVAVLSPVNIQPYTVQQYLWRTRRYRLPWLWSLVEIARQIGQTDSPSHQVRISGFNSIPGPQGLAHNCGRCDRQMIDALLRFGVDDAKAVAGLDCECLGRWQTVIREAEQDSPLEERLRQAYMQLIQEFDLGEDIANELPPFQAPADAHPSYPAGS